jgi:hypothetical protein
MESLLLFRRALSSPTMCRFIPALSVPSMPLQCPQFGIMAADDFNTVLLLTGNGAGFASFVHLRSLYERLVHAMYMASKPSEARAFAEGSPIDKLKFLTRLLEFIPELKARFDDVFMEQLQKEADLTKAARKQSIRNRCIQPITQHTWTRASHRFYGTRSGS